MALSSDVKEIVPDKKFPTAADFGNLISQQENVRTSITVLVCTKENGM